MYRSGCMHCVAKSTSIHGVIYTHIHTHTHVLEGKTVFGLLLLSLCVCVRERN